MPASSRSSAGTEWLLACSSPGFPEFPQRQWSDMRYDTVGRVLLSGMGGDLALTLPPWSYWIYLLRRGRLSRLARDTLEYSRAFHRPPGFGLRTQVRKWRGGRRDSSLPDWIKSDYVERVDGSA